MLGEIFFCAAQTSVEPLTPGGSHAPTTATQWRCPPVTARIVSSTLGAMSGGIESTSATPYTTLNLSIAVPETCTVVPFKSLKVGSALSTTHYS